MDQPGNPLRNLLTQSSMKDEAHEQPLHLKFQKLCPQYYTTIESLPTKLGYDCIFNPKHLFN